MIRHFRFPRQALRPRARHLVSSAYLERLDRVAARYRVPVVELPRPEHALEWCRMRGLGLSREAVEDSFLQGVALRLRRVRRVSQNGERVTIGVWPERLEDPASGGDPWPAPHSMVDRLPGITICRIAARGPDAEAVLKEPGFDPGRSLRLVIGGSPARERIEVWDQHGELRLGEVHRPTGRRFARDLRSNRIGEVRALSRTVVLRGRAAGRRWLTILVAPPISISVDEPEAEHPTLPGWDWWAPELGEDR